MIIKTKRNEYLIHVTSAGYTLSDYRRRSFVPDTFRDPFSWKTVAYTHEQGKRAVEHFKPIIQAYEQLQVDISI